jgi:hypothetical protein
MLADLGLGAMEIVAVGRDASASAALVRKPLCSTGWDYVSKALFGQEKNKPTSPGIPLG